MLTLDQHRELGHDLKTARIAMVEAIVWNAYPFNSVETRSLESLEKALSTASSKFDDALAREQPQMPNPEFFAYYYSGRQTHPDRVLSDHKKQWAGEKRKGMNLDQQKELDLVIDGISETIEKYLDVYGEGTSPTKALVALKKALNKTKRILDEAMGRENPQVG